MSTRLPHTDFCSFCEYISGRLPWHPIIETDMAVAFLNVRQRSRGSLLVAPRRHVGTLVDLVAEEITDIFSVVRQTSHLLTRALSPDGLHTWCNSGEIAGQSEPHMHFQIVPRYEGVPYGFERSSQLEITSRTELEALAALLDAPNHSAQQ
jgi:diadenosine tetraphosphate (Ap4A) HIT family hydrolase